MAESSPETRAPFNPYHEHKKLAQELDARETAEYEIVQKMFDDLESEMDEATEAFAKTAESKNEGWGADYAAYNEVIEDVFLQLKEIAAAYKPRMKEAKRLSAVVKVEQMENLKLLSEAQLLSEQGRTEEALQICSAFRTRYSEKDSPLRELQSELSTKATKSACDLAWDLFKERKRIRLHKFALRKQQSAAKNTQQLCNKLSDALATKVQQNAASKLTDAPMPIGESSAKTLGWHKAALPGRVTKFFRALETLGGEAATKELKDECDFEPSSLWTDYPRWKAHLTLHCERSDRGVYKLKAVISGIQ